MSVSPTNDRASALFSRSQILIGSDCQKRLQQSSMVVFGLGGVGSFVTEALARSGVGRLTIVDFDDVAESNINRQIYALRSTLGQPKAVVAQQRIGDINPDCEVRAVTAFHRGDILSVDGVADADVVLDCIDSFSPKLYLIRSLLEQQKTFLSSMGAAGKLDPAMVRLGTMAQTSICPMARRLRKFLRKNQCSLHFPVVYSVENPCYAMPLVAAPTGIGRERVQQGSMVFVPAVFGMHMASWACRQIIHNQNQQSV
ncbi:UBA/THIF-type NAD/FAD binding protein [Desulfurispirillum indicum S5]|uniref:UBA/THIF-type NAD/FAD binding protein n=1 Tax=Desulfurispirillum indicum (strain ATCC BAA-1389 / DSM 22839 / S5) TaxID=653733 RepID=E6W1D7_DESIS|nr:tRNA threonylcarbamoyladenosine dehydratase [Desulfurispirillum indicum]ADU65393.1 UBA/THIF-type NAD/FAD binding protein [Desulfurispirillum indicum S5]